MFTEIFVRLLQQKEITAYRIAKETGISQGLMNEYKLGKKLPTLQNIQKIADYLGCSVDYLLGRTDNPNISAEAYIGGDNNGVQAIKSGDVTFNNNTEKQDEMETELLKAFRSMTFIEKLNVMNFVLGNKKLIEVMHMKKIIALTLALTFVLSTAGCGNSKEDETLEKTESASAIETSQSVTEKEEYTYVSRAYEDISFQVRDDFEHEYKNSWDSDTGEKFVIKIIEDAVSNTDETELQTSLDNYANSDNQQIIKWVTIDGNEAIVTFFQICPHVLSTRFHMWTYVIMHKFRICFLGYYTNIRK